MEQNSPLQAQQAVLMDEIEQVDREYCERVTLAYFEQIGDYHAEL